MEMSNKVLRVKDERINVLEAHLEDNDREFRVKNERLEGLEALNTKNLIIMQQLQKLLQEVREKKEELINENEYVMDLKHVLVARECMFNEELQDGRKNWFGYENLSFYMF